MSHQPLVNIVVRTFNEEDWIRSCLTAIFEQDYQNKTVTIVDSGSTDATRNIVAEFADVKLVEITDFLPGKAINIGIQQQESDYVMILSAHCLIKNNDCISVYVKFLEENRNVAGAYGRQLPLRYTHDDDARDLILTFGTEQKIQRKDSFFHNANSMLRRSVVEKFPIDNTVKHIEDRLWAAQVINAGCEIAYLPEAAVYHYHGLHQHGRKSSFRAEGVVSVLRKFGGESTDADFKEVYRREFCTPVVIMIDPYVGQLDETFERVQMVINQLTGQRIYIFSDRIKFKNLCDEDRVRYIDRSDIRVTDHNSFREVARKLLSYIENDIGFISDALNFVDMSYMCLDLSFIKLTRKILFERFYMAVIPAWQDRGNYWKRDNGVFVELNVNFNKREDKSVLYRSVLGQGGCVRSSELRSNREILRVGELVCTNNVDIIKRIQSN